MNGIIAALMGVMASTQCSAVRWTSGPVVEGNMFKGTAAVSCEYQALGNGGFPQLEAYMVERMKKQATQIFVGPVYGQTEGMPSTAYEFEMQLPFQGEQVTMRQAGYVATDDVGHLVSNMGSKSVTGTGNAKLLKKFDLRVDVVTGNLGGMYQANLGVHVEIEKPGLVPAGLFKSQVQQGLEKTVNEQRDAIITELQNNT